MSKQSLPKNIRYASVVDLNGKIYAIGGYEAVNGCYAGMVMYDPGTNTWITKASMPTARQGAGAAAVNGKIYVIGGFNGVYLNTVEEYNPTTDTWTAKAAMPTARGYLGVAASGGKIYAVGGYNGSYLNTVEEYNPATNTWAAKTGMSISRGYLAAAAVNSKIYAVGGYAGSGYSRELEEYDPVSNTWRLKVDMPTAKRELAVVSLNGRLYAIGGSTGGYLSSMEKYNPTTDAWTVETSMPTARSGLGAAAVNGYIYAVGGYNGSYLDRVEEYNTGNYEIDAPSNASVEATLNSITVSWNPVLGVDGYDIEVDGKMLDNGTETSYVQTGNAPDTLHTYRMRARNGIYTGDWSQLISQYMPGTGNWDTRTNMPTARHYFGAAEVNGKIYAIGGGNSNSNLSAVEEYNPATNTWTTKASMPTARYSLGVVAANGRIYAIGGHNGSYLNTVEEYNPVTNTWTTKANMPTARCDFAVVALNGKIYAIGGLNNGSYLNKVEEYDPATNTWTAKASMPTARYDLAVAAVNGKIYAIGGYNGNTLNMVEEYNPATNTWTTKANMPTGRYGLSAVTVNGRIYAIGGIGGTNIVEEYNPAKNTWQTNTPLLTGRQYHASAVVNGKIYAIGGYSGVYLNSVESFVPAANNGFSLKAEYFDNIDFTNLKLTKVDETVNFDWGTAAPQSSMGADTFSVRWTGQVQPRYSEEYTFYTNCDDGVRLWIDGKPVIEKWMDQSCEYAGKIVLEAGKKYDIKLEYYDNTLGAKMQLSWSSPSQPREIIPHNHLFESYGGGCDSPGGYGTGLKAEYYDNIDFTNMKVSRVDETVNFNWASSSPDVTMGSNTFSAKWTGQVRPRYSEEYTFYTDTDDGVRLWVNGKLLVDRWGDQTGENSGVITLEAGKKYDVKMEYFDNTGGAKARLLWASGSQEKEVIQRSCLYPAYGGGCEVTGNGLKAEYYDNMDFTNLKLQRIDKSVYFDWEQGSPDASMGTDTFSVRWLGQVEPQDTGDYTFYTYADDGVRLWVDNQLLIDSWTDQRAEHSGTISLTAGKKYDIKLEYYDNMYGAAAKLLWSGPGLSKQTVQFSNLYPTYGLGAVSGITATEASDSITLVWDAASGATGYDIEVDGAVINTGTATTYVHSGLTPETQHTYRVRARNSDGTSNWSTALTKSTLPKPPAEPANVAATATIDTITVTWDATAGATGYDMEVDGMIVDNGTSAGYVHSGLAPNTLHTYRVRAKNSGGPGEWSTAVSKATPLGEDCLSNITLTNEGSTINYSPAFSPGNYSYQANVSYDTASITVTPASEDGNAVITVNGNIVERGQLSPSINLNVGSNTITIKITSMDGSDQKTYTITVTRDNGGV